MKTLASIISPLIAFIIMIFSITFVLAIAYPFMTDNAFKKYILAHKDKIVKEERLLVIPNTEFKYYKDITLRLLDCADSTYQIVFWGKRESILWIFKLDKEIRVNIPYEKYNGKNIELDEKIFELIKENNIKQ